jgi:predicted acyl esterase
MIELSDGTGRHTLAGVDPSITVPFRRAVAPAERGHPGFRPGTEILTAGSVHREGGAPLAVDIRLDRDVEVLLRDGTAIYVDVYRPVSDVPVPVILAWSPYDKTSTTGLKNDMFENRMHVSPSWEDGLGTFESVSPGYWVTHGYAVVNADPRGIGFSDGDIQMFGHQHALDEYDTIEWLGVQAWSDGRVALAGNSWLAITQWFVAALRPPHLAAIAPWEGLSDLYVESAYRGGIPETVFSPKILGGLVGHGLIEDQAAMIDSNPLFDDYWKSKKVDLERIEVPAYIVASWTNLIHTRGTLEAWRRVASDQKWLRVHATHEWHDLYRPSGVEDLRRFFDHVVRGIDNGWDATPPVRLSILDPGHEDTVNRPESTFPLSRERHHPLYLRIDGGRLTTSPAPTAASVDYAPDEEGLVFRHTFDRDVEITGYSKARLWVSAQEADDLDVFVTVSKLDREGEEQLAEVVPGRAHAGANGRLRASRRALDEALSTPSEPVHTFREVQKLAEGEIVPLEIGLWPYGIRFHAGETLQMRVNGVDVLRRPEFPDMPPSPTINRGRHLLHAGGIYDSHLLLPFVDGAPTASQD